MLSAALFCLVIAAPPSVEGKLTVDGKDIALTHVYALYHDNEDGVLLNGPELRVLFADREMDSAVLQTPSLMELQMLAHEGKVQGVVLSFDPKAETRDIRETVLYKPADETTSMPSINHSGEDVVFSGLKVSDAEISGTAADEAEGSSFSAPFSYSAKFNATIEKLPAVTERLSGADAAKSPQAKALMDFEEAVRNGDFDAAAKLGGASKLDQVKQIMEQVGKDSFLEQAKQFIPDRATRAKQITSVVVRGKQAVVIADEGNGTTTVPVVMDGAVWKVE